MIIKLTRYSSYSPIEPVLINTNKIISIDYDDVYFFSRLLMEDGSVIRVLENLQQIQSKINV